MRSGAPEKDESSVSETLQNGKGDPVVRQRYWAKKRTGKEEAVLRTGAYLS